MSEEQNTQQLLRDAITAAREGDKARARLLLEEIVEQDDQNEKAWYWLASVAETDEDRILYLNNVIAINPNNDRARSVLHQIEVAGQRIDLVTSELQETIMLTRMQTTDLFTGQLAGPCLALDRVASIDGWRRRRRLCAPS